MAGPTASQDALYGSGTECTNKLQQLTIGAAKPWAHESSDTFTGGTWTGGAANAASGKAKDCSDQFIKQQDYLVRP